MSDVINRETCQLLKSVNTPEFDPLYWIINPDLSGVDGVHQKYWKIIANEITEMSQAEKDEIDQANAGNPPVILDLTSDQVEDFRLIDYKSGLLSNLHKVVTEMYYGEVREVCYYTDEMMETLALKVQVFADENLTIPGYSRNTLGQPLERWTKRTWYCQDGTPHDDTKVTKKKYSHDNVAQMREGIRRRTNVMDALSVEALRAHCFTTAVNPMSPTDEEMAASYAAVTPFIEKYEAGVTTFIRSGRNAFLTPPNDPNVTDDTTDWLDNNVEAMGYPTGWTIRTIILARIKNISEA